MNDTVVAEADPEGRADRFAALLVPPIDRLGGRGTIVTPLALVFVIALCASGATWAWAGSAPPGSGAALLRTSGYLVWVLAVVSPLAAALKGLLFAAMAWGSLVLLGGTPPMRPLFSALLYGEAILVLQGLWITAGAMVVGAAPPGPGGAMPIPSGLDLWVGANGGALLALAQQVTPFHLAWVLFLTLAFASHGRVSRGRGLAAALLLWGLSTGLAVLRIPTP